MGYAFDISKTIVKKTPLFGGTPISGGMIIRWPCGLKHPGAGLQPVVPNAVRHSHLGAGDMLISRCFGEHLISNH